MRETLSSPFQKLRHFALGRQGTKEAPAAIDEGRLPDIAKCMEEAADMYSKFEGLLANVHIICGAAYDFSRSLQDMASYMEEAFGEMVDQEIGNIFRSIAKVQFEMSNLLDHFSARISKAVVKPTQSMMNKIEQAEIMKDEYDKRKLYILSRMEKQKGKSKRGKGSSAHQFAEKNMLEQANLLTMYIQSLRRNQSENLVNQAVKFHSAHMHLFSQGLASINAVQPMIKQIALDRMIDTTSSGEEVPIDDLTEISREGWAHQNDSDTDSTPSASRHSLIDHSASLLVVVEPPGYPSDSSKSAPISPLMYHRREAVSNIQESFLDGEQESVTRYALPSPCNESGMGVQNTGSRESSEKHSLPNRTRNFSGDILETSNRKHKSDTSIYPCLTHRGQFTGVQEHECSVTAGSSNVNFALHDTEDVGLKECFAEKGRRYTQSGPLIDSDRHTNVRRTSPNSFYEHAPPPFKSGPLSMSPPLPSVPHISELHKLPLPPPGSVTPPKSPNNSPCSITRSAPLGKVDNTVSYRSHQTSPLPNSTPSKIVRSLSIPRPIQLQNLKGEA